MDKRFSACEVVELGVQIEKNGRAFYSEMAKKAGNQKAAAMFEFLSDEEEKHIAAFREISAAACDYEPEGAYPDEYFVYMNQMASQNVFTRKDSGAQIARDVRDYIDGIDVALKFEKDSILFYEEMRKMVPENNRDLVDKLISEEKKHVAMLCEMKGGCAI